MTWNLKRGFLPDIDPVTFLNGDDHNFVQHNFVVENLATNMTAMLDSRCYREEVVYELRKLNKIHEYLRHICKTDASAERAMMLFSYFASAYVYATHEKSADRIPKEIAIPLTWLGRRLQRPPILAYPSYCLSNWCRVDPTKDVELGNIGLLQNFTHMDGREDEDWFILVHVDIEAKAAPAIQAIAELPKLLSQPDLEPIKKRLFAISHSMFEMNATLRRMPEECSSDVYYHQVRPYIFSFENVKYETCWDEPQTFRGETGAQSSCVPALQIALGVQHKESMLTKHLRDMRTYMPKKHRDFLGNLEKHWFENGNTSLRDYALDSEGVDLYNDCIQQLAAFRTTHLEYAVNYIQKKVENPKGTGGTPYIEWLSKLASETEEYYL